MRNVYVIYTNVNRTGWNIILETPNRRLFQDTLYALFDVKEHISVISKYRSDYGDYLLACFHNHDAKNSIDLSKTYRFLPKKGKGEK